MPADELAHLLARGEIAGRLRLDRERGARGLDVAGKQQTSTRHRDVGQLGPAEDVQLAARRHRRAHRRADARDVTLLEALLERRVPSLGLRGRDPRRGGHERLELGDRRAQRARQQRRGELEDALADHEREPRG